MIVIVLVGCSPTPPDYTVPIESLRIWVDQSEVTAQEFEAFRSYYDMKIASDSLPGWVFDTDSMQWIERLEASHLIPDGKLAGDSLSPAVHVSWEDACAYCNARNGRLPTVEEWAAMSAGEVQPGNIWEGYFPYKDEGMDGYAMSASPVRSFKPNALNLFDIHGNVREWTSTKSGDHQYFIKGGSFLTDYNSGGFLPGYRAAIGHTAISCDLGFRCVYDY